MTDFVDWCSGSFLELNVSKTKDMSIDFRNKTDPPDPVVLQGERVELVSKYRYLGTILDNKLSWEENTDAINKKAQQRLFFLRKLRYFQVDNKILTLFYRSYIESILAFSLVCWFGNAKLKQKSKLTKIINICSKITGIQQGSLSSLYDKQLLRLGHSILKDPAHPLHPEFSLLPSGRRYLIPKFKTNRTRLSFIPQAIRILNSN